jgi:probable lipoprotein NlpC
VISTRAAAPLALLALALGCASAPPRAPTRPSRAGREVGPASARLAARTAASLVGAPYRSGGASPRGFDCSGLVVYSYARAGVSGLPHSAEGLEAHTRPVALRDLEPGDLLFFRLGRKRTSHVAIYVGKGAFVHAPSSGRRVERVRFDDVYWGPRLRRAGRLEL